MRALCVRCVALSSPPSPHVCIALPSLPCASIASQSLSLASATRLLNLLELFGSPRFIFARPYNAAFAGQLVESINNVVQYQYETNAVLGEGEGRCRGARYAVIGAPSSARATEEAHT